MGDVEGGSTVLGMRESDDASEVVSGEGVTTVGETVTRVIVAVVSLGGRAGTGEDEEHSEEAEGTSGITSPGNTGDSKMTEEGLVVTSEESVACKTRGDFEEGLSVTSDAGGGS